MRSSNLQEFVRQECANYVSGRCVARNGDCLVEAKKRCEYFERAVFPIALRSLRARRNGADARDDRPVVLAYRDLQHRPGDRGAPLRLSRDRASDSHELPRRYPSERSDWPVLHEVANDDRRVAGCETAP